MKVYVIEAWTNNDDDLHRLEIKAVYASLDAAKRSVPGANYVEADDYWSDVNLNNGMSFITEYEVHG